jgi:hypothetical protein
MASEEAKPSDFTSAGYLAALLGRSERSREIFHLVEDRFPRMPVVFRLKGSAMIDLNKPAEALEAFNQYEQLLAPGVEPDPWNELLGASSHFPKIRLFTQPMLRIPQRRMFSRRIT